MSLTQNQLKAKSKVEKEGKVFIPPNQYKELMSNKTKPQYSKRALKTKPNQVASYSARKAYKADFKEISPDTDLLIDQMLNPEDCTEVTRWPNTYGMSSVYKCKTILNAKFDLEGRSCVAVAPTIKNSIFATWGAETEHELTGYGAIVDSPAPYGFQQVTLDSLNETCQIHSPIIFDNGQALVPFPDSNSGNLLYPVNFVYDPVGEQAVFARMTIVLPNAISNQARVRVNGYGDQKQSIYSVTGNVDALASIPELSGRVGYSLTLNNSITGAESWHYFSIELIGARLPYKGPVYVFFTLGSGPTLGSVYMNLPNHAQHVGIYDIKDAGQIEESASQAFVLSQSLLLTAEMSDINNGGMLAIARVPAGNPIGMDAVSAKESINANNWYEWLASLSNNNYDGAVKEGGYAWYLPEDETGFFYRTVDNYFSKELPYLASEFTCVKGLEESSIVRIKICTIVQFTTSASVYDQRPSCHVNDLDFVHHILSLVPAAYSNDGHKESLKKLLKVAGTKVKALLKDPNTYVRAAQLAGMIAKIAASLA